MCSYSGCVLSSVPESLSATYYHSRREACTWKEKQRELGNITGYGVKFDISLHNYLVALNVNHPDSHMAC